MVEILQKMLTVDPEKRVDWNFLLNYPIFQTTPINPPPVP